jgi:hypothetical protein
MPTNVPPQYRKAEERFREAVTVQEKIAALQEMMVLMPKHKGTDHLKAQHRARLSKLMAELEDTSSGGKGGRAEPFSMPKEGGGRATLVGLSNSGKSLLLSRATGAKTQVGAYALSTQEPVRGMLRFKDVRIQLVDTPPISNPATQGRLYGLLRNSEVFVIVADLTMDPVAQVREVIEHLGQWGFSMLGRGEERDEYDEWRGKPTIVLGNKADLPEGLDGFELLEAELGEVFPVIMASAEEGVGLDELASEVFSALGVIRVYTKSPREKLEQFVREDPFVLPIGSTVAVAAERIHKDLGRSFKFAVLWGQSGKFEAQRVGPRHELADEDIIELHS